MIERSGGPLPVEGQVRSVEATDSGQRVVLTDVRLRERFFDADVRVRLTSRSEAVWPGSRIRVLAMLAPPAPPASPGSFDFARQAWFLRLGAVGYAVGRPEVLDQPLAGGVEDWIETARHRLTQHIMAGVGGESGAVAAALITGEQAALPDNLLDAYRDSGLAHLLSISGLHMSLLAAMVFLVVRGGLALVEPVALRHPIKKWAAGIALVVTAGYLLLAGAPVPAQRAFIMTGIALLAVLVDRTAISMRTLAWAAVGVLLWHPEALIGASFQMSFAAVTALVAAYEAFEGRLTPRRDHGLARRFAFYVAGVMVTTLIAGTATAVFALHHFGRFASWSLAANLAAVPITGIWVMPLALLALILMPLGLDQPAWTLLGWGLDLVNAVAREVAGWPGASLALPPLPMGGLVLFTLGGLWLCLWTGRPRLAGIPLMVAGIATLLLVEPPDLLVDGEARSVAVRGADGRLMVLPGRGLRMLHDNWAEQVGEEALAAWPASGETSGDGRLSCDAEGCVYRLAGRAVAVVRSDGALAEDCRADAVVALIPVRGRCAPVTIDRFDLWRNGAHALWVREDGVEVRSAQQDRGARPWSPAKGRDRDED